MTETLFAAGSITPEQGGTDILPLLDKWGLSVFLGVVFAIALPYKILEMKAVAEQAKAGAELTRKLQEFLSTTVAELNRRLDELKDEVLENRNTIRDRRD